jgi:hypothetical protein
MKKDQQQNREGVADKPLPSNPLESNISEQDVKSLPGQQPMKTASQSVDTSIASINSPSGISKSANSEQESATPPVPVVYAVQSLLNNPATAAQTSQILADPSAADKLSQIANDFLANVNSGSALPNSPDAVANYRRSVDLADQQYYSWFGQAAFMLLTTPQPTQVTQSGK